MKPAFQRVGTIFRAPHLTQDRRTTPGMKSSYPPVAALNRHPQIVSPFPGPLSINLPPKRRSSTKKIQPTNGDYDEVE
jgi:hypothetical protein